MTELVDAALLLVAVVLVRGEVLVDLWKCHARGAVSLPILEFHDGARSTTRAVR